MAKILIIDAAGSLGPHASAEGMARIGQWFLEAYGSDESEFEIVDAVGRRLPDSLDYGGMIISGSPASAYEQYAWLDDLKAYARQAIDAGLPTLGVCFGHQVLGAVLGARVARSPNGWELGLAEVQLTGAGRNDPLFRNLPDPLSVLQSHGDAVMELPAGATLLARNAHTGVQAFAFGDHVRSIQFHPECTPKHMAWAIGIIRSQLEAGGVKDVSGIIDRMRPTPQARRVLYNFQDHFCR